MKLLIDENLPKRLKEVIKEHEVYSVSDKSWQGKKNGELLKLMLNENFEVLITFDKNLQYQQNFSKYPISVIVINASDNTFKTVSSLVPEINKLLNSDLPTGAIEIIES
jgi:predicted nuclease of predicted toxin-antitoxin system